jgi:DNA repair protein RadD
MATILRPYQELLKSNIYEAWNSGHRTVLAIMPTGAGKTRTFCSIAIDMLNHQERKPTAIMVHRKELVQQISLTLAEEGIMHNIIAPRPTILNIISAQRKLFQRQFYDYNAYVTVISVDTLNARYERHKKWAESIKFWITDEAAHLLKENKWGKAVGYFPNAIGLGVTATPRRLDKRGLGRHADGVFDTMIEGPTSRWLIEQGFLSKYKIAVPASDYRNYLRKASEGSDYSHDAMLEASNKSHIVGDVVENYIKFAHGKQAILFASDIMTAKRMEDKFKERKVSAKLLTAETDDKERFNAMVAFKDKQIKVLINVDLFDEGLDVPGIEVVIMARPTKSLSKYLQCCGRGLRPMKGKDFCIIIDHVGNVQEHGLPCTPREWTLDRIVKRQDRTNLIRICENPQCCAPFDRILTECPWCKTEVTYGTRSGSEAGAGTLNDRLKVVDGDLELLDPEVLRAMYEGCDLEDPAKVGERVARVAGAAAGIAATKNQIERKKTQRELSELIAKWAGRQRHRGYSDRQIHKMWYLEWEMTITVALSQTRADMQEMIDELKYRYRWLNE